MEDFGFSFSKQLVEKIGLLMPFYKDRRFGVLFN